MKMHAQSNSESWVRMAVGITIIINGITGISIYFINLQLFMMMAKK